MGKRRSYTGTDIEIGFEADRCIHARNCFLKLPAVFDPSRRAWVDPDGAPAEEIAAMVRTCPSGALTFRRLDGGRDEAPPAINRVAVLENGPLAFAGDLREGGRGRHRRARRHARDHAAGERAPAGEGCCRDNLGHRPPAEHDEDGLSLPLRPVGQQALLRRKPQARGLHGAGAEGGLTAYCAASVRGSGRTVIPGPVRNACAPGPKSRASTGSVQPSPPV